MIGVYRNGMRSFRNHLKSVTFLSNNHDDNDNDNDIVIPNTEYKIRYEGARRSYFYDYEKGNGAEYSSRPHLRR